MGDDGVYREAEGVGNLFVAQPFGNTDEDVLLAVAQEVGLVGGGCCIGIVGVEAGAASGTTSM